MAHERIGVAIHVHSFLGMGLMQASYKNCLLFELEELGIAYEENVEKPLFYKNRLIDVGVRIPLLIENRIFLDVQAQEAIQEEHVLTVLNQLRHADLGLDYQLYCKVYIKGDTIRRVVSSSAS